MRSYCKTETKSDRLIIGLLPLSTSEYLTYRMWKRSEMGKDRRLWLDMRKWIWAKIHSLFNGKIYWVWSYRTYFTPHIFPYNLSKNLSKNISKKTSHQQQHLTISGVSSYRKLISGPSAFELSHGGVGCVTSPRTPGQNDIYNNSDTIVIIVIIIMIESFRCHQFALSSKGPIEYRIFQSGVSIVETRKKVRRKSPSSCFEL